MALGGGPQLGELEAGVAAQLFGPMVSVVSGGLGCLVATAVVARREARLRHYTRSETSPPPSRISHNPRPSTTEGT
jgi:hypothetical protein